MSVSIRGQRVPSVSARRSRRSRALLPVVLAPLRWLRRDPLSLVLGAASVALVVLFATLLASTRPASAGSEITLSAVNRLAGAHGVTDATLLDHDARVVLRTRQGATEWAAYPSSDVATEALQQRLARGGAEVVVDQQAGKPVQTALVQFLLPVLLLACLFGLFARLGQDGGAAGFMKFSKLSSTRRRGGGADTVTFAQVAGAREAVAELEEIRDFLADPGRYAAMGARAPKGVLLVGPPGTGKTLLARATAGEADAAFFRLSGAEFVESLVGVGAARVRDLFATARKAAPAIIFIDELDAAGRKRGAGVGQGNDEREQTLNQLLVEMDGFDTEAGVIVMAATNRPDILDPALLRPGRFDRQVTVDVPDLFGRAEILELHLAGRPVAPDVEALAVARQCPGFSGAELANLANEAALLAVREGQHALTMPMLEEAIERVVSGPANRSHILSEEERWTIAVHEASHAVVSRAVARPTTAQRLSIVARGRQLGAAAHMLADRDLVLLRESTMRANLMTILAGAAGELHAYGEISTGVQDDLHAATRLARSMVTSFGMSRERGLATVGEAPDEVFLGASLHELGAVAPDTLSRIDREVEALVEASKVAALAVLERNWAVVERTADALMEHETLSGLALNAVLDGVEPHVATREPGA